MFLGPGSGGRGRGDLAATTGLDRGPTWDPVDIGRGGHGADRPLDGLDFGHGSSAVEGTSTSDEVMWGPMRHDVDLIFHDRGLADVDVGFMDHDADLIFVDVGLIFVDGGFIDVDVGLIFVDGNWSSENPRPGPKEVSQTDPPTDPGGVRPRPRPGPVPKTFPRGVHAHTPPHPHTLSPAPTRRRPPTIYALM